VALRLESSAERVRMIVAEHGCGFATSAIASRYAHSGREVSGGGLLSHAQVSQHERARRDENMMKRHPSRLRESTRGDPERVTSLDQRTDGQAQLVHTIGFEQRAKQRRAAFAQYLPQPALRELGAHGGHVEAVFATQDDVGHTGKCFLLRRR
jgi:hypothetical protein